ncbi:MAG TPA: hypothetical protein PKZ42_01840 [Syntrophales bacterium]|nr:hypothetical protein [Syntrophales bacterium]
MKLSEYRNTYYEYTGKTSNVTRQLAFAGIALIWIYKVGNFADGSIPKQLILSSALLAISLTLDLLHYVWGSFIWGVFCRQKEKQLEDILENPELSAPAWYNWPSNLFFWLKILAVIIAYYSLIKYFIINYI